MLVARSTLTAQMIMGTAAAAVPTIMSTQHQLHRFCL